MIKKFYELAVRRGPVADATRDDEPTRRAFLRRNLNVPHGADGHPCRKTLRRASDLQCAEQRMSSTFYVARVAETRECTQSIQ